MLLYLVSLSLYVGLLAALVRLLPQPLPRRFTVSLYIVATLLLAITPWLYLLADLSWRLPIPTLCVLSIGLVSGVAAWRKLAATKAFSFGAVVTLVSGLLAPILFLLPMTQKILLAVSSWLPISDNCFFGRSKSVSTSCVRKTAQVLTS